MVWRAETFSICPSGVGGGVGSCFGYESWLTELFRDSAGFGCSELAPVWVQTPIPAPPAAAGQPGSCVRFLTVWVPMRARDGGAPPMPSTTVRVVAGETCVPCLRCVDTDSRGVLRCLPFATDIMQLRCRLCRGQEFLLPLRPSAFVRARPLRRCRRRRPNLSQSSLLGHGAPLLRRTLPMALARRSAVRWPTRGAAASTAP